MPKVIKDGVFSNEYGFPQNPPAELEATCHFCLAELETTEAESQASISKRRAANGYILIGWCIPCPQCGKKVFFVYKDISPKLLSRLNGWDKLL